MKMIARASLRYSLRAITQHAGVLYQGVALAAVIVLTGCAGGESLSRKDARDAAQNNAQLGANYLQRGNLNEARSKLEKALKQDDDNALAHVTYAQLQQRINSNKIAAKHFKIAIELEPEQAELRNSYGIFLCQTKAYGKAEKQFQNAAKNPFYPTPEYALDNAGLCMLDANKLNDAETYLRRALRANPQFANAYLHMADLLHRRERLQYADAYLQRFQTYAEDTAESLYLAMKIKRDSGDTPGARSYANRLLNDFPTSQEASDYLARPIQ